MASSVSETSICNLALQMLGAERITGLDQATRNARSCLSCYAIIRDRELSRHPWNFARKHAELAPSATEPTDPNYVYAFPLPSDFLELLTPTMAPYLDWQIAQHLGANAILTNENDVIDIDYVASITDPTQFHMTFVYALAAAIAEHLAEELTQSNTKKEAASKNYLGWIREARRRNAFANISQEPPEDVWLSVRR